MLLTIIVVLSEETMKQKIRDRKGSVWSGENDDTSSAWEDWTLDNWVDWMTARRKIMNPYEDDIS